MDSFGSSEENNVVDDRYLQCLIAAKKRGYVLHKNPTSAQNRCFYECIAETTGKTVEEVIYSITEYMLQNQFVPKNGIDDDDGDEEPEFEDLLSYLSDADFPHLPGRPETWRECIIALQDQMANSVVIRSTASCFALNINVIDWNENLTEIAPFDNKAETSVFLAYTGLHYMLLKPDQPELELDNVDGAQPLPLTGLEEFQSIHLEEDDRKFAVLELQFSRLNIPDDLNDIVIENASLKKERDELKRENEYLRRRLQYYENVPHEMEGFKSPFNCAVSCGLSCVLFVFFKMELQVCNRRFINMFPDLECCSLALNHFFNIVRLLIAGPRDKSFHEEITEQYSLDRALEDAVEKCMPGEVYPALLVLHYKQKGSKIRADHCVAIMPDGKFIDVQKKRYWKPNKSDKNTINSIYVVRVNKKVAERWLKTCGLNICKGEGYYDPETNFFGCTDDLD